MNQADQAIAYALAQVGKPYGWGQTGPDAFDCSGLVMAAYRSAGINLPRITQLQILSGTPVTLDQLAPGDLCFPDSGHVQIYLGQNSIVEAPSSGHNVRTTAIWGTGAGWQGRRVTDPGQVAGGTAVLTAASATQAVSISDLNPFHDAAQLTKLFGAIWNAIKWPANPSNWLRVAEFIGGAILIGFALHSFGVNVPMPQSQQLQGLPQQLTQTGSKMKQSGGKIASAETELPKLPEIPVE